MYVMHIHIIALLGNVFHYLILYSKHHMSGNSPKLSGRYTGITRDSTDTIAFNLPIILLSKFTVCNVINLGILLTFHCNKP